jgi:hypothetical protein
LVVLIDEQLFLLLLNTVALQTTQKETCGNADILLRGIDSANRALVCAPLFITQNEDDWMNAEIPVSHAMQTFHRKPEQPV